MNHLLLNPDDVSFTPDRDFKYTFLSCVEEHYPIQPFYDYMNYIDQHTINNIYHHLLIRWSLLHKKIGTDKNYKHKKIISYDRGTMDESTFNERLVQFVDMNKTLAIFVMNSLIQYFHPTK